MRPDHQPTLGYRQKKVALTRIGIVLLTLASILTLSCDNGNTKVAPSQPDPVLIRRSQQIKLATQLYLASIGEPQNAPALTAAEYDVQMARVYAEHLTVGEEYSASIHKLISDPSLRYNQPYISEMKALNDKFQVGGEKMLKLVPPESRVHKHRAILDAISHEITSFYIIEDVFEGNPDDMDLAIKQMECALRALRKAGLLQDERS